MLAAVLLLLVPMPAAAASPVAAAAFDDAAPTIGEADFTAVAADPSDPRLLYAAAAGAVYRTDDGGRTWSIALGRQGAAAAAAARDSTSERERDRERRAAELLEDAIDRLREDTEEEVFEQLVDELGEDEARREAEDAADKDVERERDRLEDDARARAGRELPGDGERGLGAGAARDVSELGFVRVYSLRAGAPRELLVATNAGLYRSSDGGATLRRVSLGSGLDRGAVAADQDPREPSRLFVATRGGLLVAAGAFFGPAVGELGSLPVNDVDVNDLQPDRICVGTDSGLFVSADGGVRFSEVLLLPVGGGQRVVAVAWDQGAPDRAFAAVEDGKLYVTEDGGATFELLATIGLRGRARRLWAPKVPAGADPLLYVASDQGLYVTTDGGDSFQELFAGLASKDVRAVATPAGLPEEPIAATGRGLFRVGGEQRDLPGDVRAALDRLAAREPRPDEVVRRAAEYLELPASRFATMQGRARWAAAGPRVVAAIRPYHTHDTEGGATATGDQTQRRDKLEWAVRATWDLQRAIFATDEPAVSRALREVVELRQALGDRVVRIFLARRRLVGEVLAEPTETPPARALRVLKVEEQTARLDAVTGGWYSEELARRADEKETTP